MVYVKNLNELVKPDWITDEYWATLMSDVRTLDEIRADGKANVDAYLAGDESAYDRGGYPVLLLTTIGRKSGKEVIAALSFAEVDGSYLVVGSIAGTAADPFWALNLRVNPRAWVQVREKKWEATARQVTAEERTRYWAAAVRAMPLWEVFQQRTDREFPLFVVTPKR